MRQFLDISSALSDESRVRAVLALAAGEVCVCQLIDLLGLAPSTVSRHMAVLEQAGLVRRRKEGRWHYYRLPMPDEATPLARSALAWLAESLARSPEAARDRKQLKTILRRGREEVSACCYRG